MLVLAAVLAAAACPVAAAAAGPARIAVTHDAARLSFPQTITFQLSAQSDSPIQTVNLRYGTSGQACQEGHAQQAVTIEPGTQIAAEWTWDLRFSGTLPPGVEVWWQWEITDASGLSLTTPRHTVTVTDDRYSWQSLQRQGLIIAWSRGDAAFGQNLLRVAQASLDRLVREVGVRPESNVNVVAYPDSEAVRGALLYPQGWTGAVAFPEYDIILIPAAPGDPDRLLQYYLAHELAHLVVRARTFNCYGVHLPVWLNEGLAVYLEGPIAAADRADLVQALAAGRLGPLLSLANDFPRDEDLARLAYTYSGEVATYMIRTYGPAKMPALLDQVRSGKIVDDALQAVYGLDTDGLDAAWRQSVGLPSLPTAAPTAARTAVPTLALWTPIRPSATSAPPATSPAPPTLTALPSPTVTTWPSPSSALATPVPAASATPAPLARPRGSVAGLDLGLAASVAGGVATVLVAAVLVLFIRRKG